MNVGIATIAAFLLLLPGIAFIVGVNIADKNVREIVFRNTPAELGYVIAVSLAVHLLLAIFVAVVTSTLVCILPLNTPRFLSSFVNSVGEFNAGAVYLKYQTLPTGTAGQIRNTLIFSLLYFLVAGGAGFDPGFHLGRWVRVRRFPWTTFFVKHRWMLDLIQIDDSTSVTARAVLTTKFTTGDRDTTDQRDTTEHPLILQGLLRDSYFGSDGKLLYLVFKSFVVLKPDGSSSAYLSGLGTLEESVAVDTTATVDQLLVEGARIEMVRFSKRRYEPDTARMEALEQSRRGSSIPQDENASE